MKGVVVQVWRSWIPGLLFMIREYVRRYRRRPLRSLRLVDSVMLAERRQLAVVEFGEELLLLGAAAGEMRLLARTPRKESEGAFRARRSRASRPEWQRWVQ